MDLLAPPTPGKTTSEHRLTLWAAGVGTALVLLTAGVEALVSARADGVPWAAAVAVAISAAAAAYAHSRGRVKAAHEAAKAEAFKALSTMSPEEKSRALESLAPR